MRESDLLELISGISRLSEVANRLRSSSWTSAPLDPQSSEAPSEEFDLCATPTLPFGLASSFELLTLHSCRCVEDGPPELPFHCLQLAQSQLGPEGIGQLARARRALRIGFWSRAAVDTHTDYSDGEVALSLPSTHWVVLRSTKVWTVEQACRFESETDFNRFVGEGDASLVASGFPTLLELHLFSIGANIWAPRLLRWRNRA